MRNGLLVLERLHRLRAGAVYLSTAMFSARSAAGISQLRARGNLALACYYLAIPSLRTAFNQTHGACS